MSKNLENFTWSDSDVDVFAEMDNTTTVETPPVNQKEVKEPAKQTTPETTSSEDVETPAETEENVFDEIDSGSSAPDDQSTPSSTGYKATLEFLKGAGTLEYELEDGEELTEDLAKEIFEDSFEESVNEKVKSIFTTLPQEVKDLNTFVINGGNYKDFFNKSEEFYFNAEADLTNKEVQEGITRQALKDQGYDEDYISTQIDFLKDTNKLETISKTHFNKMKIDAEKKRQATLESQRKIKEQTIEERRNLKNSVNSFLESTKDLKGLQITKKDKKELPTYMIDKSIKLDNGNYITPMQKDLFDAVQNTEKAVIIAKLLQSDFNLKDFEKAATTRVTNKIEKNLTRNNKSSKELSLEELLKQHQ